MTKLKLKGLFWCKFNPWSNTQWHLVRPPLRDQVCRPLVYVALATSEKDRTIIIHCSMPPTRNCHQKATNNAQNSTKLQQQYRVSVHSSRHHMSACLAACIIESRQGKEWNCAFLTVPGNQLARTSPQQEAVSALPQQKKGMIFVGLISRANGEIKLHTVKAQHPKSYLEIDYYCHYCYNF